MEDLKGIFVRMCVCECVQWGMWLAQIKVPARAHLCAACTFLCHDAHTGCFHRFSSWFCYGPVGHRVCDACVSLGLHASFLFVCVCAIVVTVTFSQLLQDRRFHGCNGEKNNAEELPVIGIWYLTLIEMLSTCGLAATSNHPSVLLGSVLEHSVGRWIHWLSWRNYMLPLYYLKDWRRFEGPLSMHF